MATETAQLKLSARTADGSRANRRLRRRGMVPGIVYGAGRDPEPFEVDALLLFNTLKDAGTLLEITVDGGKPTPVIVQEAQRHPVRGELTHVDFLRVHMNRKIQTTVWLELTGEAAGVKEGGVLDQPHREITVEALPANLPEAIHYDVSELEINSTATIADITELPEGVELVDDPEIVIASVTPPTVEPTEEEIETETEVLGEGEVPEAASEAEAEGGSEAAGE